MLKNKKILITIYIVSIFLFVGCKQEAVIPKGVVALVNDVPISLRLLEAAQDIGSVGLGVSLEPSVDSLKQQYGEALVTLIVRSLVMQELQKRKIEIPAAQLEEMESKVRNDYTEEEFEKALTEDNISIDIWRELLRSQLAMEIFAKEVLRSNIYVSLAAIEEFYEIHKKQFNLPRTLHLRHVFSADASIVAKTRAELLKTPDKNFVIDNLTVQDINIRKESVPKEWQREVGALSFGQATAIKNFAGLHQFVLLKNIDEERQMSLIDAYPLIESILLEEKLNDAFDEWLVKAVPNAKIKISTHLLPTKKQN